MLSYTSLLEPPRVEISSSTIPRCQHSVYYPQKFIDAGERNYGCQGCNANANLGDKKAAERFVMPASGLTLNGNDGKLRANAGVAPGECPNCRSRIHIELSTKLWECAECSTTFAVKGKS
jgi:hypothetical protein